MATDFSQEVWFKLKTQNGNRDCPFLSENTAAHRQIQQQPSDRNGPAPQLNSNNMSI